MSELKYVIFLLALADETIFAQHFCNFGWTCSVGARSWTHLGTLADDPVLLPAVAAGGSSRKLTESPRL